MTPFYKFDLVCASGETLQSSVTASWLPRKGDSLHFDGSREVVRVEWFVNKSRIRNEARASAVVVVSEAEKEAE